MEFRAVNLENGEMLIEGYAIVYDSPATHKYGDYTFTEVIQRGALDFTDMTDVVLRYNHKDDIFIMARTKNGSLQLEKDDKGLKIKAQLIDTQTNKDIFKLIQSGLIEKMSFAFNLLKDGDKWNETEDGAFRTITGIRSLHDVSIVDVPFYDSTSVYARNIEMLEKNLKSKGEKNMDSEKEKKNDLNEQKNDLDFTAELRKLQEMIAGLTVNPKDTDELPPEARKVGENNITGELQPMASYRKLPEEKKENEEDIYSSIEYRKAFKDYVVEGKPIPDKFIQKRADTMTIVSDVGAVIPTVLQNKVIEDITTEGKILGKVTQTAFQGAVDIPISDINFTATWLNSENEVSEEQKAEMNAKISFGYHVLEARVSIGLLTATVTLPVFEATVVKQLKKAMLRAIEKAIVEGTGAGQPLGFTKYELPEEQVISMTEKTISTVKAWAAVEAAIPEEYENDGILVMSKATWEKHINSMTDTTGQKIGLGKINEKGNKILNGREVLTVDVLPSFDNASDGEIWGVVIDLSNYCLNSNLAMYYKKYFDEDKNKWVHKSLMIADGKMTIGEVIKGGKRKLVGAKGLIYLKKGSNVSA